MIDLTKIKVDRNHPDYMEISWHISPTEESLENYSLDIYSCEAPSLDFSEYEKIGENISLDTLFFEDHSVKGLYHGTRN